MMKNLKIILVLAVLLTPVSLGIFAIIKLFPEDIHKLEKKGQSYLAEKIPFLASLFKTKAHKTPKNEEIILEDKTTPIKEEVDFFTNKDVYKAICEMNDNIVPLDKFIGCNHCPKYMELHNGDYFSLLSYAKGSILRKNEKEAIFFMHGCREDLNNTTIILRESYGGWQKVAQFKQNSFMEPPLTFKDKDGIMIFVGKRKIENNHLTKETLYSLSYKDNKIRSYDILSVQSPGSVKCSYQFTAELNHPEIIDDHHFSIKLDVLGWEEHVNSDCKFPNRNFKVSLKPGTYTLHFKQKESVFVGDKQTKYVMTELEKAQE